MKTTSIYAGILLMVLVFASCKSDKEKQAINKIDSIKEQNGKVIQKINGSFHDSVKSYLDSLTQLHAFFKNRKIEYLPENNDLRQALHQTRNAHKILDHYSNRHLESFNEKFEESNNQLLDLKHDIENNLIEDSLINDYVEKEDSAAKFLQQNAIELVTFTREHFSSYRDRKEDVNTLKARIREAEENKQE